MDKINLESDQSPSILRNNLDISTKTSELLSDYEAKAQAAIELGLWSEAERIWHNLLNAGNGSLKVYLGLCEALVRQKRFDEADAIIIRSLSFWPEHVELLRRSALLNIRRKKYSDAVSQFAKILRSEPDDCDSSLFLTIALGHLKRFQEAEDVIGPLLAKESDNLSLRVIAAEISTELKNWPVAAERWLHVTRLNPNRTVRWMRFQKERNPATPWVRHIEALVCMGAEEAAQIAIRNATRRYPDDLPLQILRAELATSMRQWNNAGRYWDLLVQNSGVDIKIVEASLAAAWSFGRPSDAARYAAADTVGDSPISPSCTPGFFIATPSAESWNKTVRATVTGRNEQKLPAVPSLEIAQDALIMPHLPVNPDTSDIPLDAYTGGAFSSQGHILANSLQYELNHIPEVPFGPKSAFAALSGRWLFGSGRIQGHIGHFLMDCLARLWAVEIAGESFDGILFMLHYQPQVLEGPKFNFRGPDNRARELQSAHSYIPNLLRIFAGMSNYLVVTRPLKIEELIVPTQLMSLNRQHWCSHTQFRQFIRRRVELVSADTEKPMSKRVYISRSRMRLDRGPLFLEEQIELALAKDGYTIVYPEELSLEEQFQIYWHASHIVISAGTACHIASFAMNGSQHVAVIARFPNQSKAFLEQLQAFGARQAIIVDAITGSFQDCAPNAAPLPVFRAPHAVDVARVLSELRRHHFLSNDDNSDDNFDLECERNRFLSKLKSFAPNSEFEFVPRGTPHIAGSKSPFGNSGMSDPAED